LTQQEVSESQLNFSGSFFSLLELADEDEKKKGIQNLYFKIISKFKILAVTASHSSRQAMSFSSRLACFLC
jgi:hypothetical protein